jgi:AcrR family transcriptional regulator
MKKAVAPNTASTARASENGRRPRRSTETVRALILQAARELFAERGYAGATTREIALRADTNEVLLFRHFTSKAQLFEQAVFEPFQGFMHEFSQRHPASAQAKPPVEAEAHEFVEGLYEVFFRNRRLMMALIAASLYEPDVKASMADVEAVREYFSSAEAYMRRESHVETRMEIATGVRLSFGLVAAAVLFDDWLFAGGKKPSARKTIEDLTAFIVGGFETARASPVAVKPKAPVKKPRKAR